MHEVVIKLVVVIAGSVIGLVFLLVGILAMILGVTALVEHTYWVAAGFGGIGSALIVGTVWCARKVKKAIVFFRAVSKKVA
ncbi:hypothetical protein HQ524_00390 [Candidatus Uhrbacteria bacterium]|nr:hypothetical protein [Candidatus Uhrbacteria bacterium]